MKAHVKRNALCVSDRFDSYQTNMESHGNSLLSVPLVTTFPYACGFNQCIGQGRNRGRLFKHIFDLQQLMNQQLKQGHRRYIFQLIWPFNVFHKEDLCWLKITLKLNRKEVATVPTFVFF